MPTIAILRAEGDPHTVQVSKPMVTIGRRNDNDLSLPNDPRISRHHARLSQRDGDYVLEDIGSANGTFLGQRRIHGPTLVRPGDRFRMGRTWMSILPEARVTSQSQARESVRFLGDSDPEVSVGRDLADNVLYTVRADLPAPSPGTGDAERRLEIMRRIGATLASTLDLGTLVDRILGLVMEVIPAERGFVMLVDRQTGEFQPQAMRVRNTLRDTSMVVSRNLMEYAINERVAFMTADAMSDERFQGLESVQGLKIRAALCAPLLRGEEALGAVFLDSTSGTHMFGQADVEMLMAITNQVVTALDNARLYTDLRQAYEGLQSAQEQLLRSERLSTVGSITASIAHDMANIVTPLKPLIEMSFRGCDVDPDLLDALTRQVDRLTAMVSRVTSFSRPDELRFAPTNVNDTIQRTMALIKSEVAHSSTRLEMELQEDLPEIMADAAQLDRVFLNLAMNAIQAMEGCDNRSLTIRTEHDGEEVTVSFIDTGPGIPLAIQDRLFEPLFTTKKSGTGLGLPSCKRIVEDEHHGTIAVDSVEGEGSTFSVHLPLSGARSEPVSSPSASA